MEKIKDNISSSATLANALRKNGASHLNYKMYTSMERALGLLISGYLYLFDGQNWNDVNDREVMQTKGVFAKSFSRSTSENVAMWMLYGDERGKKGAMLNFHRATITELLKEKIIELGKFDANGKFTPKYSLSADGDFEIFITDMLYVEKCDQGMVRITLGDEHVTASELLLNHPDIFYKKYPWAYEQECRLVVRVSEKWKKKAVHENLNCIRLIISEKNLRRLRKDRLIRSPVYMNGADNGIPSLLTGDVDWNI